MDDNKIPEEKELTFAERMKIEPVKKHCICGKSQKYPICDGSHSKE